MSALERECEFLNSVHHPNLVQYLGTWKDPVTNLPVLLMELMDESLSQFLEKYDELPPPFHTQVNICHDVALALSFLHSNDIIHRHLTSNNVLMIGDKRAKVADFGTARFLDLNPHSSLSKYQGCEAYLPPEAATPGGYSPKLDCFSFGVLTIQVLTQQPPQPGEQFKIVQINDPNFPNGIETRATEADRRKDHIDLIASNDPLQPVAMSCIKDKAEDRPSSGELCNMLASIKEMDHYTDSLTESSTDRLMDDIEKQVLDIQKLSLLAAEDVADTDDQGDQSQSQAPSGQAAEREINRIGSLQRQIEKIRSREQTAGKELESLKSELQTTSQQLQEKDSQVQAQAAEFDTRVRELERKLEQSRKTIQSFTDSSGPLQLKKIRLEWEKEFKAPCKLSRTTDGVASTEKNIYIHPGGTKEIYVYNIGINKWSRLPDTPVKESGIAIVKRKLTVIGGQNGDSTYTSKLLSLIETAGKLEWIVLYPPMSTQRSSVIVLNCQNSLIVAGGENESGFLRTVEVMDIGTQVWQTVANLPEPLIYASAAFSGSTLFILGGWVEKMTPTYSLLTTSLDSLLQSTPTPNAASEDRDPAHNHTPWQEVTHLPLKGSTCVCVNGRLLAIGGRDIHKPVSAVHTYNPLSNTWELVTHLTHPRHQCFATVMEGRLLVMGGYELNSKEVLAETNVVEIANIV